VALKDFSEWTQCSMFKVVIARNVVTKQQSLKLALKNFVKKENGKLE
jgi:hypothetical protein